MVIALGHRHRLMAGAVVDLLDRDAEVEHSCNKGVAEIMGPDMAEARSFACRTKALANRRIGDDPVPSGAAVFAYLAPAVVVGVGAHVEDQFGQINQNTTQRQQLGAAYQQMAGAIAGLYEFAPDAGVEAELEAPAENGQPDLELVEA
jgi:hypothetical protein